MEATNERVLQRKAAEIRKYTLQEIQSANSGHIGGSFSIAELLAVLYFDHMNIDPNQPKKEDRDRFVLSKGHCSPAVYAALAIRGYFPVEELKGFRKIDSFLSGHIEMKLVPGVDMTAGSLGQGLSAAAGMALHAKTYNRHYNVYCIVGDGELQEGQIWEAAMASSKYKLNNLVLIVDNNHLQIDGPVEEIMPLEPLKDKLMAFGWEVLSVDGHNISHIKKALMTANKSTDRPVAIIADTIKGKGVSVFENQVRFHGGCPTAEEYEIAHRELDAELAALEV